MVAVTHKAGNLFSNLLKHPPDNCLDHIWKVNKEM